MAALEVEKLADDSDSSEEQKSAQIAASIKSLTSVASMLKGKSATSVADDYDNMSSISHGGAS